MSSEKMSIFKKVWDLLGSRELSVFLFIAAITYSLIAYVFSLIVSQVWFDSFQTLLPMLVLYIAFFINLIICEIKWIPVVVRRCRYPELPKPDNLGRFGMSLDLEKTADLNVLKQALSKGGYQMKGYEAEGKTGLYYIRGLTSPIGNLVFHISFLFLLAGILVGLLYRTEGKFSVIVGNQFDGKMEAYDELSRSPLSELPDIRFTLNAVTPRFWKGQLLFTDLRSDITLEDGSKGSSWLSQGIDIDGANVTVNGIGYAIRYTLSDKEGRVLKSGISSMPNLFMPGMEDTLTVPGYPHRFLVAYYPDAKVKGGDISNVSMDRKNPMLGLRVYRGRLPVFTGLLKEGEVAEFDNLRITFPEIKYRGDFKFVKNPGFMLIWTAFAMMITGLIWRFLFYRKEVLIIKDKDEWTIYLKSEFFPGLFEIRIREMAGLS